MDEVKGLRAKIRRDEAALDSVCLAKITSASRSNPKGFLTSCKQIDAITRDTVNATANSSSSPSATPSRIGVTDTAVLG